MRRRRRRQRPLWFPPLGVPYTVADVTEQTGFETFGLAIPNQGAVNALAIPLTFDLGQETLLAGLINSPPVVPSLSDLMGSSWRLRRVVGKLWCAYHVTNSGNLDPLQTSYPACVFGAGLMVRNVDELALATKAVDPLNQNDYTDPWIWRRTWILGQDARFLMYRNEANNNSLLKDFPSSGTSGPVGSDSFAAFTRFPNTTAHYGSVQDGPHVDAKTNRVIGPEQRLMLHIAVKGLPIQPEPTLVSDNQIVGAFDFRMLGNLMRSTNRRNASR